MSALEKIFKKVAADCKKDPYASVHQVGDITIKSYIPWGIPTGLPELDFNLGRPGWPAGRCVELYGFEHCGKTTLAYHAIAQAQRMGGTAVFIDTEKSWDEDRAHDCGVQLELPKMFLIDADSVDAAFRSVQSTLEGRQADNDGKPFVIVIDSITGVATEAMKAKTIGEVEKVAVDAKAIRGGMRRIIPDLAESKTNLFMVNHATSTIAATKYAKQSDSSGGHSIKLAATVRCAMNSAGWIKDDKEEGRRLGQLISLRVEKLKGSKLDYPQVSKTPLLNTVGFDTEESLLRAGCKSGWIQHTKGSKTYAMGETTFPKADWPAIVMQLGGVYKAYQSFIDWCVEQGSMNPWGKPLQ